MHYRLGNAISQQVTRQNVDSKAEQWFPSMFFVLECEVLIKNVATNTAKEVVKTAAVNKKNTLFIFKILPTKKKP